MKNFLIKGLIFSGITIFQIGLVYIILKFVILQPPIESSAMELETSVGKTIEKKDTTSTLPVDSILNVEEKINLTELRAYNVLDLPNIIVNPFGSKGKRYLVLSVVLYLKDTIIDEPNSVEEIAVRDAMISVLSRRDCDWLSNIDNRVVLREQLALMLKELLNESETPKIYITKFVIQ